MSWFKHKPRKNPPKPKPQPYNPPENYGDQTFLFYK